MGGRGGTTGYDMAVALPGLQSGEEGDDELFGENNKVFDVTQGRIEMEVNKVNAEESEIGGFSLLLNCPILIWDPRHQRRFLLRESSTQRLSKQKTYSTIENV